MFDFHHPNPDSKLISIPFHLLEDLTLNNLKQTHKKYHYAFYLQTAALNCNQTDVYRMTQKAPSIGIFHSTS